MLVDGLKSAVKHNTHKVHVGNVTIGGGSEIVIQSMTNTDTSDIEATVNQIIELAEAGSEVVRITVNDESAARAVPHIKERILHKGYDIPIVGCFHYNGHRLLDQYKDCAKSLDKYRINPGNVGFGLKKDRQFDMMVETALKFNKPVRIGVNWGSLDQSILASVMDDNSRLKIPKSSDEVMRQALITSTLNSAIRAENIGMSKNQIIISTKVSRIKDLILVYQQLARQSDYTLHLGLTEAGIGIKGMVATSVALGILLNQGIGDTIRASITPKPNEKRELEVQVCKEILQTLGIRSFAPSVSSCPGCGRTTSTFFQELTIDIQEYISQQMLIWKKKYIGVDKLNIAVMGCIVNGPGESKHADIGISLPGNGESPVAPVFIDGSKACVLRGENIANQFKEILNNYILKRFENN